MPTLPNLSQFEQQATKTGFVLENAIARHLKSYAWTVISNRFYVDDSEETVREIDLVAYRATKVQHIRVYTVLIISCKKSETNSWALFARKADHSDPNTDWTPLHVWTNDKGLGYQIALPGCARKYHGDLQARGVVEALRAPDVEVFAFQEMLTRSGAPQNDKAIFSSVTSLMKAQSYEVTALPLRRRDPAAYQFNLLAVVDAPLIRLMFKDDRIQGSAIDSEHYIGRYIVRKKETVSRIRILRADRFLDSLADYDRLHTANCAWFSEQCDAFYKNILEDYARKDVLAADFKSAVGWYLRFHIEYKLREKVREEDISVEWRPAEKRAAVLGNFSRAAVNYLSGDAAANQRVAQALKNVYRYEGPFIFDEGGEIPF